ncbi:putative reverse transcriptase domain-containing protein, partial [Tanacetum coccineum]
FHELARLVPHLVTPENKRIERYVYGLAPQIHGMVAATEPTTIQSVVLKAGVLTDEAIRNGSIKKNPEKRGNGGEPTSGQLVEIDKVIRGCKLEIEGHVFDINLIPFGSRSFDVIIGMDLLLGHETEIICHEKVVRIPLLDGKVLRMLRERPEEKVRYLLSATAKEHKQEEIVTVRDFPEVFPDDLYGLPHIREIEFQIELIPEAIPVAKSPYRLAPSKWRSCLVNSENLRTKVSFDQAHHLGEHQCYLLRGRMVPLECVLTIEKVQFLGHVINGDGIHVDPSNIEVVRNWEALRTPSEVRSFLGLAGYYRRFIENFSKIAKPLTVLTQKSKTFDWGEEQEIAFLTLKDKLCNTPVLALFDGPKDFVVYCDASGLGLGCVLMLKGLFGDYDCEIRYHLGKANVVVDALSRKERVKPKRVRAMNMTLQSSIKDKILAAQKEASDEFAGLQKGIDKMIKCSSDGALDRYWWLGMKKDIAVYGIAMYFVTKLPRTSSGHDTLWVIMDRLTKSAHFLPMCEDYKMDRLARLYLNEIVVRHGVPILIISDRDSRFTLRFWQSMQEALGTRLYISMAYHPQTDGQSERTIQTLEDMLRACVLDFGGSWDVHLPLVEFLYNNKYHSSVTPFEALYSRKCRSPIMWAKVREGHLIGPQLVQETTKKISQIKDRLKAARDRQKSYADKRRKPLEFSVGDYVLLKVSPWKVWCVSDISELRLQEHWDMLVVTSGDARSWYMISEDANHR